MRLGAFLLVVAASVAGCGGGSGGAAPAVAAAPFAAGTGGTDAQYFKAAAALPDGSTLAGGYFSGTAEFAEAPAGSIVRVAPPNEYHGAVVRYDGAGNARWASSVACVEATVDAIVAAPDGSFVVAGVFEGGSATVNAGQPGAVTLPAGSGDSVYVARYAANGTLLWARADGGAIVMRVAHAALLSDGSCVVAGSFHGTATFDTVVAPDATATTVSGEDASFLAKYRPDGSIAWTKFQLGTGYHFLTAVAVLADDTVVAAGYYSGTSTFGEGEANETVVATTGNNDAYLAYFASLDGSTQRVERIVGAGRDRCVGVCRLANGSVAVCGAFIGDEVTFAPGTPAERTLTRTGAGSGLWLAQYGPGGVPTWIVEVESDEFLNGGRIAPMPDGGVALICTGPGTTTFGRGEPSETTFAADGTMLILTARFLAGGTLAWARSDGAGEQAPEDIAATPGGFILVAGHFRDAITFGAEGTSPHLLAPLDNREHGFVARMRADGTY